METGCHRSGRKLYELWMTSCKGRARECNEHVLTTSGIGQVLVEHYKDITDDMYRNLYLTMLAYIEKQLKIDDVFKNRQMIQKMNSMGMPQTGKLTSTMCWAFCDQYRRVTNEIITGGLVIPDDPFNRERIFNELKLRMHPEIQGKIIEYKAQGRPIDSKDKLFDLVGDIGFLLKTLEGVRDNPELKLNPLQSGRNLLSHIGQQLKPMIRSWKR